MDRLRRSLRDSFRKKKDHVPECSKPHQWQADEAAVRAGTCNFPVKYLGCVEVFESRGMQVCEDALKLLRNSRRRPVKGVLYVTGDGLRVVDDDTKGLIVDQTIEKVSFCAPDRSHDKGFSYICRDGTTRRWMCHGFLAVKDSGERLSHAVGCAFAACLERKQKRDKECGVTMTFDPSNSTFTRTGSFRQTTLTERMQDPQECKPVNAAPLPQKSIVNPFAVARPHATPGMLQRQGSFRGFQQLSQNSPFKRQLSLRLNDLPSNLERTRALDTNDIPNNRVNGPVSPILESSPVAEKASTDSISAMCQQLAKGLTYLSNADDPFVTSPVSTSAVSAENQQNRFTSINTNNIQYSMSSSVETKNFNSAGPFQPLRPGAQENLFIISPNMTAPPVSFHPVPQTNVIPPTNPWALPSGSGPASLPSSLNAVPTHPVVLSSGPASLPSTVPSEPGPLLPNGTSSRAEEWLASAVPAAIQMSTSPNTSGASEFPLRTNVTEVVTTENKVGTNSVPKSSSNPLSLFSSVEANGPIGVDQQFRRAPQLSHLRSHSLGTEGAPQSTNPTVQRLRGPVNTVRPPTFQSPSTSISRDPFDAEWATSVTRITAGSSAVTTTNPFKPSAGVS